MNEEKILTDEPVVEETGATETTAEESSLTEGSEAFSIDYSEDLTDIKNWLEINQNQNEEIKKQNEEIKGLLEKIEKDIPDEEVQLQQYEDTKLLLENIDKNLALEVEEVIEIPSNIDYSEQFKTMNDGITTNYLLVAILLTLGVVSLLYMFFYKIYRNFTS